ncbi:helix-turn-helix transcriptional regulator [Candidatus Aalborgicola defluviihabitans]|uniref:helix-turn-helix transcriptional regulator n=1 Tax=Candidatus Aalborgicola defluviihabitans TaxID=3386187 RepID=UPI0039B88323
MNRSERFYKIDQLLAVRKVMSRQDLLDALEVSWATLKRDLAYMRDRLNAPIEFDRDAGGYRFGIPTVGPSTNCRVFGSAPMKPMPWPTTTSVTV